MIRTIVILVALMATLCVAAAPVLAASSDEAPGHGAPEAGAPETGHATAAVSPNPLTVDPDLAIFTAIVFLLLLAILGKFAWRPIMDGLDKRESTIAAQIEEAKQSAEMAQKSLQQYESKLASAQEEVSQMLAAARRDAESAKDSILEDARTAAERERDRAVADIQAARDTALSEVANQSAALAVRLAGKIVARELNQEDHAQLIRESIQRFPSRN